MECNAKALKAETGQWRGEFTGSPEVQKVEQRDITSHPDSSHTGFNAEKNPQGLNTDSWVLVFNSLEARLLFEEHYSR